MPVDLIQSVISLFSGKKQQGKQLPYVEVKTSGDSKLGDIDVMRVFGVPRNRLDALLLEFTQAAEREGTRSIEGIRACFDLIAKKSLTANEFAAAVWIISSKCTESACKRDEFRKAAFVKADMRDNVIM